MVSWCGGLTSFLISHTPPPPYVVRFVHQQVGQSNTMKEHTLTLISATYFSLHSFFFSSFIYISVRHLGYSR